MNVKLKKTLKRVLKSVLQSKYNSCYNFGFKLTRIIQAPHDYIYFAWLKEKTKSMRITKYHSCSDIENFHLVFRELCMDPCCQGSPGFAKVLLKKSGEKSIKNFVQMHDGIIAANKLFSSPPHGKNIISSCTTCKLYELGEWKNDGLIHHISFSVYPSPCQCKCIYCDYHNNGRFKGATSTETRMIFKKVFDAIDYARKNNLIADDALWTIASGEITIHPFKDKILDCVKNQAATFHTNCFIFDEKIALNIAANPRSRINLSIDSGTAQTWFKVKGVDNFQDIKNNLIKYHAASTSGGQIELTYIILPGINDNNEDYSSLIELMKILKITHLTISCDNRSLYQREKKQSTDLVKAAARLAVLLQKNDMTYYLIRQYFSGLEGKDITVFAN